MDIGNRLRAPIDVEKLRSQTGGGTVGVRTLDQCLKKEQKNAMFKILRMRRKGEWHVVRVFGTRKL